MKSFLSVSTLCAVAVVASPVLVLDVVGPPSVVDIHGLTVTTILKNVGHEPLKLLKEPNTILSTIQTDKFTISSASGSPSFTGIKVKYSRTKAAQSENGFIVLAPGQSVEKVHSLAGAYNFTCSGEGQYNWFGEYKEARHDLVSSHFNKIGNHATQDTRYDCSCPDPPSDEEIYAYVIPEETGTIYLCSMFWGAANMGPDSKPGTIVHENSHFTAYGDTMDYEYGQESCTKLAEENPDQAVMNADNHEYFVETMEL
ncbi:hypothetical protein FRC07_010513 [Ceratobasidium sp. 392]|nr:hypothetical protein FRC07_010513 [Ceratobasidium sp. 392]